MFNFIRSKSIKLICLSLFTLSLLVSSFSIIPSVNAQNIPIQNAPRPIFTRPLSPSEGSNQSSSLSSVLINNSQSQSSSSEIKNELRQYKRIAKNGKHYHSKEYVNKPKTNEIPAKPIKSCGDGTDGFIYSPKEEDCVCKPGLFMNHYKDANGNEFCLCEPFDQLAVSSSSSSSFSSLSAQDPDCTDARLIFDIEISDCVCPKTLLDPVAILDKEGNVMDISCDNAPVSPLQISSISSSSSSSKSPLNCGEADLVFSEKLLYCVCPVTFSEPIEAYDANNNLYVICDEPNVISYDISSSSSLVSSSSEVLKEIIQTTSIAYSSVSLSSSSQEISSINEKRCRDSNALVYSTDLDSCVCKDSLQMPKDKLDESGKYMGYTCFPDFSSSSSATTVVTSSSSLAPAILSAIPAPLSSSVSSVTTSSSLVTSLIFEPSSQSSVVSTSSNSSNSSNVAPALPAGQGQAVYLDNTSVSTTSSLVSSSSRSEGTLGLRDPQLDNKCPGNLPRDADGTCFKDSSGTKAARLSKEDRLEFDDPYVCGGNLSGKLTSGMATSIKYEFYKNGSSIPAYTYSVPVKDNGSFELVIDYSSIVEDTYKIVYSAINQNSVVQSKTIEEFITNNCTGMNAIRKFGTLTIRSGGQGLNPYLIILVGFGLLIAAIKIAFSRVSKNNQ